ncbi:asparagine synthase (glutamine-hydrolyzing) [Nannocystis sp. RBIL2]|uniref:asparagine synthase (glutamine-hydrolyzing) n=1 Tax=Nannocystis sp. RBIL2 TaxID=2996788 RepID=UPI00226EE48D|nr:asparagine synthase (glutamine-hydrolyzing) [Nannocystis sp. RBIL2]MCY1067630.1 asparagine synthase (glutamine-hydrolyzing) [Nannocystis sp. RBIL2]
MCGLAGMVGACDAALVASMTAALRHRGPDGDGVHLEPDLGLGHRRLAILDLAGGAQPMVDASGDLVIVYNGEIYNFAALRAELLAAGVPLRTRGDTEVLLELWRREGPAALQRLRGMFAFAVWDRRTRELHLVRDRLGQKPLYYSQVAGGVLLFASEPKALLQCPAVDRSLDLAALDGYLELYYVPPPRSIFAGIKQLPPGHRLTWREGQVTIARWWDCEPRPPDPRLQSVEAWAEAVAPTLAEAIELHTVSDVPVGAFLSGGLDSSTIVAALARRGSALQTFCVGYGPEGASYEERHHARAVARHFGLQHHELELKIDILDDLAAMVAGFDEPFGSWTALLAYHLSRFARQRVTVALAGDGGDEVFGGYPRYRGLRISEHLGHVPPTAIALAGRALRVFGEPTTALSLRRWGRQFLDSLALPPGERYAAWVGKGSESARDRPYARETARRIAEVRAPNFIAEAFDRPVFGDLVARAWYADIHGFLPENVLRCTDRMSMAHGLEVRVPFCDHVLLEQMAPAPSSMRVTALASKRVLRAIAGKWLPPAVLQRKKLGFSAPFGAWLKAAEARIVADWLHPDVIKRRGLFDVNGVARIVGEHRRGTRDHALRIWSLIVLEQWQRMYFD